MSGSFTQEAVGEAWHSPEWGRGVAYVRKAGGTAGRGTEFAVRGSLQTGRGDVLFRRARCPACGKRAGTPQTPVRGAVREVERARGVRGRNCPRGAEERLVLHDRLRSTAAPPPPAGPPWGMTCRRDRKALRQLSLGGGGASTAYCPDQRPTLSAD
ncbi:hypothetical protein GCM10010249_02810 [Streptomyces roseolilacinus]|uniref:Uncharacterized protein n=1 Tax=Streptomyces roseolilacinus TaxID=66904 RepID=A0A918EIZ4_9ACTN|nr:hypothetical protein GCM10010249_02810 [Streptomyces roseolilacinus]